MRIEVLGGGCARCRRLKKNVQKALETLSIDAEIVEVTDYGEIADRGVMTTPALIVNGKKISEGRVLTPQEIMEALKSEVP